MSNAGPVEAAVQALVGRLGAVGTETVPVGAAMGRVLAEGMAADRESPPADVSAMDGYAVRLADLVGGTVRVAGEVAIGQRPPVWVPGAAMRIFTGGCVPAEAEAVIRREDVAEEPERITLRVEPGAVAAGQNIRRRGENLHAGQEAVAPGGVMTGAVAGVAAAFGRTMVKVYRPVRVAIIVTGNELRPVEGPVAAWEIRDSNGRALGGLLAGVPWIEVVSVGRVGDSARDIRRALEAALGADAVFLTGGVSAGDYDFVPEVVRAVGGEVVFHKLPIRPGSPVLGAVGPRGQVIMGLPGNPVSVLVTARRIGVAALRQRAGLAQAVEPTAMVQVQPTGAQPLKLWWYPVVELTGGGGAKMISSKGSGDLVAAGRGQGFVEVPAGELAEGMRAFWPWRI